ncbi:hypothetical protein RDWZM_001174 [Blomia tropicalis]|uniref:G-protein coupled receptors family 1 profile domain-containing protein n=1 Tax=Blomia tropicalis TaxID=40697 RepID=A0A9Q0MBJ2_BLOTA|nr:hypothetical protein RDWZM_001174 [Blomia tropicalis]
MKMNTTSIQGWRTISLSKHDSNISNIEIDHLNQSWPEGVNAFNDDFNIEDLELVSKQVQYFLIALYSLTAAVALLGNVVAIVVLTRGRRTSRNLSKYLINLSLSDILMSIFSIPFTYTNFIMGRWIFPPETCPLVQSIQVWSVFVSIYTLTIIGVDRYIAITRPFVKNIWSKSFAPIVVSLTWLLGFILSLVIWFFSEATPLITINSADNGNITFYDCRENWGSMTNEQIYTMTLFLIVFAIPLLILIYVYGSITAKLWTHSAPGNRNAARDGAQSRAKRKIDLKCIVKRWLLWMNCKCGRRTQTQTSAINHHEPQLVHNLDGTSQRINEDEQWFPLMDRSNVNEKRTNRIRGIEHQHQQANLDIINVIVEQEPRNGIRAMLKVKPITNRNNKIKVRFITERKRASDISSNSNYDCSNSNLTVNSYSPSVSNNQLEADNNKRIKLNQMNECQEIDATKFVREMAA